LCKAPVDPNLVPECRTATANVSPAVKPLHDSVWWANATKGFNFKDPDLNNPDLFNRILWTGIMGDDRPYPGAPNNQVSAAPRQVSEAAVKTLANHD